MLRPLKSAIKGKKLCVDGNRSFVKKLLMNLHIENITPVLYVKDMKRSLAFYVDVLGFDNADWSDETFAAVGKDGGGIYLCQGAQGKPGTWVWVGFDGDIFELHKVLVSKGVVIKLPPTNFQHAYEMHVLDPDGHVLRFGTDPDEEQSFADMSKISF